jgi:hypothetical protein
MGSVCACGARLKNNDVATLTCAACATRYGA